MRKSFPATFDNLKNIRLFLNNFLKDNQIENRTAKEIELAADEAASNIIKHGYKIEDQNNKIEIKLEIIKKKLFVHLFDNAVPVNQDKIKHRNLEDIKPGGLGSYFINNLMDEVKWKKSDKWVNHLTLIKNIKN
jgi:anti-sigma regulatory factor (Ser/Thr protein kinase)